MHMNHSVRIGLIRLLTVLVLVKMILTHLFIILK